jgi:transmembrane sensor
MVSNQQHWKQISAYLAGHLSDKERNELESWIKASKENAVMFGEAKKIWENSGMKLHLSVDETETQWQELQDKIHSRKIISLFPSGLWMKIAAGITLIAGLTYAFIQINAPEAISVHATDQVVSFYLPDSTRVWLNANSSLTYFENYGDENRKTRLTGEGYFNVKRDEAHPFVVNTTEAMVHVLGTSFNVKEDSTGTIIVTVAEGKVKFSLVEKDEDILIEKNERAVALPDGSLAKYANTNPSFAYWRRLQNPEFMQEQDHPEKFLAIDYSWRKTTANKSEIKGMLSSKAALADYRNVVLKISLINAKGKAQVTRMTIPDTILSGHSISFDKKMDILKDTHHVKVEIEKAEIIQ